MILLYDLIAAQPEGSSPVSGGGEYAVRIFYALLEQLSSNTEKNKTALHAVYDRDKPIDKAMLERAKEQSMVLHPVQNTKDVPGIIEKIGADKFFSALPMRFRNLHLPDHCEFIYTIHGLRPLELPWDKMEWHYFYSIKSVVRHCVSRLLGKYYIRARKRDFELLFSVANKQQIITVSKHSRYSLLSMFPKAQDIPIHTFFSPPLERNYSDETGASIIERLNLEPRSYYLVISANRWGKNSYRLIQVFKQLIKRGLLKRKIVVLGKGKARFLHKLEKEDHFIVCDYVSRTELETLYTNAYTFVFPTLNEGFGYPPLECMKHGTPVLASSINSLPELLQDAYLPVDPKSNMELSSRILQIENEEPLWSKLSKRGPEQYEKIHQKQISDRDLLIHLLVD